MSEITAWKRAAPAVRDPGDLPEASPSSFDAEVSSFTPRAELTGELARAPGPPSDRTSTGVRLLRAGLGESLREDADALERYRQAEKAALTPEDAGAALRAQAALLERKHHRAGVVAALRRLRKREKLKPNEHRRLFRALRALRGDALIERYVRVLRRATPDRATWPRVGLVFWSTGHISDLLAWAERHPLGPLHARRVLIEYSRNSASHGEYEPATAILDGLLAWDPDDPELLVELAGLRADAGYPVVAAEPPSAEVCGPAEAEVPGPAEDDVEARASPLSSLAKLREPLAATVALIVGRCARLAGTLQSSLARRRDRAAEMLHRLDRGLRRSPPEAMRVIRELEPLGADRGVHAQLEAAALKVIERLKASRPAQLTRVRADLNRLAIQTPPPFPAVMDLDRQRGLDGEMLQLHRDLPLRRLDASGWAAAGKTALAAGDEAAAVEFYRRAVTCGGWSLASQVSSDLFEHGLHKQAIDVWGSLDGSGTSIRARLGALRTLHAAGEFARLFDEGLEALQSAGPFDVLPADTQNKIVSIVRLMIKCALETQSYSRFAGIEHRFAAACPESGLAHWVDGMIAVARLDRDAAIAAFEAGSPHFNSSPQVALDLAGEIAVLQARHHLFGAAARAIEHVEGFPEAGNAYYQRMLAPMRRVAEFIGHQERYPECLIDVIAEEFQRPIGYRPEPGRVVTVTATLAQGGSERQLVNVVKSLRTHPKISSQTLLVRSVEEKRGFFLPELQGIDVQAYGEDWRTATDIDAALPMLADRVRLRRAIDLLPHSTREEVIRLVRRLLELRPAAVHIRQDLYAAGLACAIAGVPRFFIHRGSLARNTWVHTPLEADTKLRPMRHTYRKLLESTPFFFANNSRAGLDTDRDWTGWEDERRFRLVHNAIDFSSLGEARGRNEALRAELGISSDAKVVGGVFRIVPVKRPQLWIETAQRVLQAEPDAHFLVVGDGHLMEAMRQHGQACGLSDRLHMPGAVNNIGDWYRCMDAVLLTSEREGLPNANIEAQHFGVPVVSADVGGAAETLEQGVTGFLVDADAGPDVFAAHVLKALNDEPWRLQAAAQGPGLVRGRFDPVQVIETVIGCYGFA